MPPRPCIQCGQPAVKGGSRCQAHGGSPFSGTRLRYERLPNAMRNRVLARDRVCVECGSGLRLEVDHTTPEYQGGQHTMANLRVLCHVCHARKTAHEGHVARWKAKS
jgi:5-methylcytosine-specific restriction endonuclease McrA